MLGAAAQNLLAHTLTAGEKHHVKFFIQQGGIFRTTAQHHRHILRRETLCHQFGNDLPGGRGIGTGLEDHGVSCGDGICQRIESQQKGVVPGGEDEHIAIGRGLHIAVGGKLGQRRPNGLSAGKAVHVFEHIADLGAHQTYFAHIALKGTFAQVSLQRPVDALLVSLHGGVQLAEHFLAETDRQGGTGVKIGSLAFQQQIDFFGIHRFAP